MDRVLFDGKVRFVMMGRKYGNFHPEASGAEARRHSVMRGIGAERIFSPKPSANGEGAAVFADNKILVVPNQDDPTLLRTMISADAGLVSDTTTAVAWWGADCPIGVMFHEPSGLLAVPHLGFKNLFRSKESLSPWTLAEAIKASGVDNEEFFFWFSSGAGPCCFGYDDPEIAREVRNRFGAKAQPGKVLRGPRRGQFAIDLHFIVQVQAEWLFSLRFDDLYDEQICTSCFGLGDLESNEQGVYWSNLRAPGKKERNGIFIIRR